MSIAMRCLLAFAALGIAPVMAGNVQVQVVDAAGKPLPFAAVFLESPDARRQVKPLQNAEIAQINKQFDPHVLVIPVGTWVQFPNLDTVRHHVYSFSPAKTFDLKLYSGTAANPVMFDKPGIAVLGCNIHDNMIAWVVAVDSPYYGRTSKSGIASMVNVPAGRYRLRVWHPNMPVGAAPVDEPLLVGAADAVATTRLPDVTQ
jgi:plastocyanin